MTQKEHLAINYIKKINSNNKVFVFSVALLYIIMFCLNYFTYYTTDDYSYMYSLADESRITSISQIFSSLYVHEFTHNGRLIAHFFVYIFLMLPPICFDILNAFIFTVLVVMIYHYARPSQSHNVVIFWIIFALLCLSTGAFGEVYLWLDGSCNYLWAVVIMLMYISPFIKILKNEELNMKLWVKIVLTFLSLIVGAWQETASFGVILFMVISIFCRKVKYKGKIPAWTVVSIFLSTFSWILMTFSPGSLMNKVAELKMNVYLRNLYVALIKYVRELWVLLVIFFVLFIGAVFFEYNKKNILCSAVCFFLSLVTNFMHISATYYASRSMLASIIFLLLTISFLIQEFLNGVFSSNILVAGVVLGLCACTQFAYGVRDIIRIYEECMQRETIISEQIMSGNYDIELPLITATTKYSAKYGLKDLDTSDASNHPNCDMAKFYGVSSILGISEED